MVANGQLVFTDVDKVTFKGVGNASNAVIDTTTGKIGVGVDSPDANLHVLGNCFVSTNFELGGTMTMGTVTVRAQHELSAITATGNTTPHTIEFTNAETGIVTTGNVSVGKDLTVTGNVAVDTDTLFIDTVNDRVGVGTNAPDATLHVYGNAYVSSNLEVGTANLFVDTTTGNVGIGTTNPGAPLEIYTPTTGSSSTLILKRDVSSYGGSDDGAAIEFKTRFTGNSATYGQVRIRGVDDNLGDSGEGGFAFDTLQDQVYYERMRIKHNGNVGIGDSDPDSILHVQSDVQGTGGPIKKTSATASTSGFNYILNGPRPGTTSSGAVFFINGSTRTGDGDTNTLTIRNDSGSVDIGSRSETLVSSHTPLPETYNPNQKNVDIMLNSGSIWMSPYTARHRSLGTGTGTWSQYIGKHYLGRILSGLEIENKNTNSSGVTSYYSNLLHFRAHDYGIYGGSVGDRTMTIRGDQVGIRTETPGYTLEVNGSLFYSSGGLNGSDDRIKYNEENITNALDIIGKLKPQKYEKIMAFPSDAKGTWIPTDENWETVKNAETKPWEGFTYGDEFGFIAQDVRNIPEVSFLVSGSEMKTSEESVSLEEYTNLNEEEQGAYTRKYIYEGNVITVDEYTDLIPENMDKCTPIYIKQVETQTPLGLNYQGIFVVAVKAIQELKSENETLKTQLTSVLTRLDVLENA